MRTVRAHHPADHGRSFGRRAGLLPERSLQPLKPELLRDGGISAQGWRMLPFGIRSNSYD
jgi:hypothetical protein